MAQTKVVLISDDARIETNIKDDITFNELKNLIVDKLKFDSERLDLNSIEIYQIDSEDDIDNHDYLIAGDDDIEGAIEILKDDDDVSALYLFVKVSCYPFCCHVGNLEKFRLF